MVAARPVHAEGPLGTNGRFSPDGRWIYFQSGQDQGFWGVRASGPAPIRSEWRAVTSGGGAQGFPSPDGKEFFYSYKDRPGIFAVPVEGGKERVVLQRAVGRLWTVAGRHLFYFDHEVVPVRSTVPKPLRRLRPETGEDVLVGPVAAAVHEGLPDAFSVSADGRFLVFVSLKQSADLVLVDNFR